MAARDEQEVVLVLQQNPNHARDEQEVLFVLGPVLTITTGPVTKLPQVNVAS